MTIDAPRWLDERQMKAWRGWIEASTRIGRRIEGDLREDSDLTSDDYEVLVRLAEMMTLNHGLQRTPWDRRL